VFKELPKPIRWLISSDYPHVGAEDRFHVLFLTKRGSILFADAESNSTLDLSLNKYVVKEESERVDMSADNELG
jgi:hypothetical protein